MQVRRPSAMRPDKYFLHAAGIILITVLLIGLTWGVTLRTVADLRQEAFSRGRAAVDNQALSFSEQIGRQLLSIDQTLQILQNIWQADRTHFDLATWQPRLTSAAGLIRDVIVTDQQGIVQQASIPDAVHQSVADLDYFVAFSWGQMPADRMFIGSATIDQVTREWHINTARALRNPDGSFAGVIAAAYRIDAIADIFGQADLSPGTLIALIGLKDSKLRAAVGPSTIDPDATIAGTPMFDAISQSASGIWVGPSSTDAATRIHAFRQIPGRDLAIVVALAEGQVLQQAATATRQAQFFAIGSTALLIALALALTRGRYAARRRERVLAEGRANLAAAHAQAVFARVQSDTKAEQLHATLAGMSDGVAVMDASMCLVEWNSHFPEIADIPGEMLRVGLPIEEILRAQIRGNQFGQIADPDAEIATQIAHLRTAAPSTVERQRPDGRNIQLRRTPLPGGGFVMQYSDITDRKLTEQALYQAKADTDRAKMANSRFIAYVERALGSHLHALQHAIGRLDDDSLSPAQQALVATLRRASVDANGVIANLLDLSRFEAGNLSVSLSLTALPAVLAQCIEQASARAQERGISIKLDIAQDTPDMLHTDAGRLRQVQSIILSHVLEHASPGTVTLSAAAIANGTEAVRLTIRDQGPLFADHDLQALLRPHAFLDQFDDVQSTSADLQLYLCQDVVALLGGRIGYEPWRDQDGNVGNTVWTTLPRSALAQRSTIRAATPSVQTPPPNGVGRLRPRLPRTRILIVADRAENVWDAADGLRRAGHFVETADNEGDAIKALKMAPFDIVLIDISAPETDAQRIIQAIRLLPAPAGAVSIIPLVSPDAEQGRFAPSKSTGLPPESVDIETLLDAISRHVWSSDTIANT